LGALFLLRFPAEGREEEKGKAAAGRRAADPFKKVRRRSFFCFITILFLETEGK